MVSTAFISFIDNVAPAFVRTVAGLNKIMSTIYNISGKNEQRKEIN